jgi:3-methyladenine DNA glycosylase AlkC
MEPLKNVYNRTYIQKLALGLKKSEPKFDAVAFEKAVFAGDWKDLELKGRMRRISITIGKFLPKYPRALSVLLDVAPFFRDYHGMFIPDFVEVYGMLSNHRRKYWDVSIEMLGEYTKYSSSEFAIRAFLLEDLNGVMKQMKLWSKSENEHQRRLSSEGCRPRLPWAAQLPELRKNPKLILPILENLKTDPSIYVRKSVANNLNDISKDHPQWVLDVAHRWYGENLETDKIVKHGLRTLLKQGNQKAIGLLGYQNAKDIKVKDFVLRTPVVTLGQALDFSFSFEMQKKGKVRLEYGIYYLRKNGQHNKKVFKISEGDFDTGVYQYDRKQAFRKISTRRHYAGSHKVSLILNGEEKWLHEFDVQPPSPNS